MGLEVKIWPYNRYFFTPHSILSLSEPSKSSVRNDPLNIYHQQSSRSTSPDLLPLLHRPAPSHLYSISLQPHVILHPGIQPPSLTPPLCFSNGFLYCSSCWAVPGSLPLGCIPAEQSWHWAGGQRDGQSCSCLSAGSNGLRHTVCGDTRGTSTLSLGSRLDCMRAHTHTHPRARSITHFCRHIAPCTLKYRHEADFTSRHSCTTKHALKGHLQTHADHKPSEEWN